jgi:ABC-type multidrug transport system fused ATPase/permease subunit
VLRNISLTFERGGSYGLIGPSGSGKSSIINLLLKFYSPEAGNITANESKLSTIDDVKWSHKVLAVTSNEVFFHGTIRENLQYNNTNANTELNNAIEFVGLDRYINSLPLGMDTVIGENAVKFSAGQLQRLAIARALLWNPDVLILDEATSALDSSSEDNILQRIIIQFKERILIVISHRLSSLKYLNTMICLENGQVIENGPANVLRSESEFYRNLFHEQLEISDGRPLANRT